MNLFRTLPRDALASVVVFLVALPLCMGIAIASGMPPAKGLITGIIGGLVVGFIAGAPLQVSGPAAGLAVLVFELVRTHGMAALGPVLLLAGLIQLVAGTLRLGGWFRVTAPAVVYGMLAGIGILIVLSQVHVMIDAAPKASGLDNLLAFPGAVRDALSLLGSNAMIAGAVGLGTIASIWLWERFRPTPLRFLPGALVGVTLATLASLWLALPVKRVELPANLGDAIDWITPQGLASLADPQLLIAALALAFIASAETLLSAAAVDRMHDGPRARFNRELSAQGIGNILCGAVGALPMTGVIVRSSANVQAGARGRASTILHGAWLLALVALLPGVLQSIPVASLGAVLVYTGCKLVDPKAMRNLGQYGRIPVFIYAATALCIVFTDLLTGVLVGFALTLLKLVWSASRLRVKLVPTGPNSAELRMSGAATFLRVPQLAKLLASVEPGTRLHLSLARVSYIDHACMELLEDWGRSARAQGGGLEIVEGAALKRRVEGRQRTALA
ncbi:SulP family inorganic anion transporter [Ectopseudomonas alcaliphila]|jgi:MFS superfamily sulfate permease-like transporter|uniref:SulP family inorganic anion transporter n=2 Tax=Bacteria TaxID=2 RepID=UPI0027879F9C|nr:MULTISPECIES: SulP family inorganic anion transporter [Pseudomonas]MDP9942105.1 MFS superfamily sulfate permease-like transporter [Pseudomonas sp. 3400]MDR7014506.1 MFS superfamily sulfate permease-like transporter [Pseudomonas alcaliphila]